MTDNLPDLHGSSGGSDDDGLGLGGWLLIGGGAVIALYIVAWLAKIALAIFWWALGWGLTALAIYALYRFVSWMLSDKSASTSTAAGSRSLESSTSDEEYMLEQETDDELADLQARELDRELEEDPLEAEFAQLEREMGQHSD